MYHLTTLHELCQAHGRSFATSHLCVSEKRKTLCLLRAGTIDSPLCFDPTTPSACSFEQATSLADPQKTGKLSMYSSLILPQGWKVAMVEHDHVWIAETLLQSGSLMTYRFQLVLVDQEGHLVQTMSNAKGETLEREDVPGMWHSTPGTAFQDAFAKARPFLISRATKTRQVGEKSPKVNGRLLVGLHFDTSQALLRRYILEEDWGCLQVVPEMRKMAAAWAAAELPLTRRGEALSRKRLASCGDVEEKCARPSTTCQTEEEGE